MDKVKKAKTWSDPLKFLVWLRWRNIFLSEIFHVSYHVGWLVKALLQPVLDNIDLMSCNES